MIIVLAHTRLGGSDSKWQGFGRELSRTGVEGVCKSERSKIGKCLYPIHRNLIEGWQTEDERVMDCEVPQNQA